MKKLHDLAKLTLSAAVFASFVFVNPVKSEDLKVGFIYIGPTGDHGWTYEHDQGRKAIEKALETLPGKLDKKAEQTNKTI